jgi:uncharacterized membrane protein (DUF106 family)
MPTLLFFATISHWVSWEKNLNKNSELLFFFAHQSLMQLALLENLGLVRWHLPVFFFWFQFCDVAKVVIIHKMIWSDLMIRK